MAYDESRAMVIRFGGRYGGKPFGDTWEYDGRQWKQLSTTGPRARNHAAMVYVANRKRVVLFGGHDGDNVFGDMWQRDGRKWRETEKAGPEKRIENGH